ncbi:transcription initiation factor TFIID subunit 7-like [Styela clava]
MDKPSNAPFELENYFLMRLPPDAATKLNEVMLAGNLKDRLTLNMHDDLRHGAVKFDGECYSGKVWDLPCVIECQKTVDMKTFYKTNNLSHMLVCTPDTDLSEHNSNVQQNLKSNHLRERKFLWPHGITPPLKNVRKRRFRKTAKKKYIDSPDIEKEVKRLLKADIEAVNVRYEIMTEEEKLDDKSKNSDSNDASQSLENDELHKFFPEVSSESEKEDDDDVNVEDVDKDDSLDFIEIPSGVPVVTNEGERARLKERLSKLMTEVSELKKRKERKEQLIRGQITNEMLKVKFQGELEVVRSRIQDDMKDIAMTKAKLGLER